MTPTIQTVLISGKQGAGKTSLQNAIIGYNHNPDTVIVKVNFADPLYQIHDYCINLLKEHGITRDIVKDGPLLQLIGTEWGRKTIDENIWVNMVKAKIDLITRDPYKIGSILTTQKFFDNKVSKLIFLVGDCRFKNELTGIPTALRVRLECDRDLRKQRCSMWRENENHPSEVDLDEWAKVHGVFDLIYSTEHQTPEFIAHSIMLHLNENKWYERRMKWKEENRKKVLDELEQSKSGKNENGTVS